MWPILLDMTKEESLQHLRCLELDAYSGLVNALRAQGTLNKEKLNLLKETSNMLHVSQERHKAEIRRVVNDERLNTISYHVNGERHCGEEWADEGKRLIPLLARVAPQTAYSGIADEMADLTSKHNKQLPMPASTERKRNKVASPPQLTASSSSTTPTTQADRKRKHSFSMENCVLAQHLMAPPKISKIQQIYRQRSKSKLKEQLVKLKPPEQHKTKPLPCSKFNILQNITTTVPASHRSITITSTTTTSTDDKVDGKVPKSEESEAISKPVSTLPLLQQTPVITSIPTGTSKTITTTDGQKLIVVSTHANHNLTPTPSILQRTLTTIPFKSLAVNPKFRIVPKPAVTHPLSHAHCLNVTKPRMVNMTSQPNRTTITSAPKKIIPLSNVQVLNTKMGYKVLPMGNKLQQKNDSIDLTKTHEVNGIGHKEVCKTDTTVQSVDLTSSTDENGVDPDLPVVTVNSFQDVEDGLNDENMDTSEVVQCAPADDKQAQLSVEDAKQSVEGAQPAFDDKVDVDSSVFIYGNDNENEQVIIDGIGDQSMDVLNAVHGVQLDDGFANLKNVRS